uniref:ATP synthase F0 subunit 8 n=1 Tax=Solemya velum TaxID=13268 RepID=H9TB08_SOLVE|nr:ATP synthase F0 subunit 8 [Solemya velum]AFG18172.1 ATP synthase F0 subunit 8 [Solemya velum]AGI98161.1 ATP synthase F0 subunit 8 [Solemya velum]
MPQLSPLNWLFLFIMFWSVIFLMMCMVWWTSSKSFLVESGKDNMKVLSRVFNWK